MAVTNFQGALRLNLLADSAVAAIVGTKIYSVPVPQSAALPYATLQYISQETVDTLGGFEGVVTERWQIDAYAASVTGVLALKKAIFDALHMKNNETWSGYKIYLSRFDGDNDLSEPATDGSEDMYHRIQQDFKIKRSYETTI